MKILLLSLADRQHIKIASGNGFVPNMKQSIT